MMQKLLHITVTVTIRRHVYNFFTSLSRITTIMRRFRAHCTLYPAHIVIITFLCIYLQFNMTLKPVLYLTRRTWREWPKTVLRCNNVFCKQSPFRFVFLAKLLHFLLEFPTRLKKMITNLFLKIGVVVTCNGNLPAERDLARIRIITNTRVKLKKLPHPFAIKTWSPRLAPQEMSECTFKSFTRRELTHGLVPFKGLIARSNCPTTFSIYVDKSFHGFIKFQIHFSLLEFSPSFLFASVCFYDCFNELLFEQRISPFHHFPSLCCRYRFEVFDDHWNTYKASPCGIAASCQLEHIDHILLVNPALIENLYTNSFKRWDRIAVWQNQ